MTDITITGPNLKTDLTLHGHLLYVVLQLMRSNARYTVYAIYALESATSKFRLAQLQKRWITHIYRSVVMHLDVYSSQYPNVYFTHSAYEPWPLADMACIDTAQLTGICRMLSADPCTSAEPVIELWRVRQ